MDVALDLFAVHGFTTVSVRDIGRAVGIKESSLYYHFKNKEDILRTLLLRAEEWTEIRKRSFTEALSSVKKVEREGFVSAGIAYIEDYLLEDRIHKLIRMLTLEKQRNPDAAELYRRLLFIIPLEHQRLMFAFLRDRGELLDNDPNALALEYQSILLFIFDRYFSGPAPFAEGCLAQARTELSLLLTRFYIRFFRREGPLT
ncbi:TetR/AcrR family transcriptional regulator [Gorillibacterium sp. sgz500922]|uniref:TetR/AcrR family transcriptional regulator n=1 Tax=Gorillibacterium sp. sgz500922 TaxID=3446694 RepID=UPI003F66142B